MQGSPGSASSRNKCRRPRRVASELLSTGTAIEFPPPSVFSERIAHNVISVAGTVFDDGSFETDEEKKFRDESRKILGIPELRSPHHLRPCPGLLRAQHGDRVELERELSAADAHALLSTAPGVVLDDVPTPLKAAGGDVSFVGRIRNDPTVERGLALFISGDNLRKGAASTPSRSQKQSSIVDRARSQIQP